MNSTASRNSLLAFSQSLIELHLLPSAIPDLIALSRSREFSQDFPDGSPTGVNIRPFPGFVQTVARGGRRPTPGSPNGGRDGGVTMSCAVSNACASFGMSHRCRLLSPPLAAS